MTIGWLIGVAMIYYYSGGMGPGIYMSGVMVGLTWAVWYFMDWYLQELFSFQSDSKTKGLRVFRLELTLNLKVDETRILHALIVVGTNVE